MAAVVDSRGVVIDAVDEGLSSQDSDDELPIEWEVRTTETGRVYYANHQTKTTQWRHPKTGHMRSISGGLPIGWIKQKDSNGSVFYVNFNSQQTTLTDPRILKQSPATPLSSNKFDSSSTAEDVLKEQDLSGKVIIITGASSGIGYATASALALHGAHVIMACKNLKKAERAASRIQNKQSKEKDCKIDVMLLDLGSFKSIRRFAEEFKTKNLPLHVLVCNAGVMVGTWRTTEDDIEHTFAVNYLGHFLLVQLLQSALCASAPSRIVMVSSESHRFLDFNYSCKLHLSTVPLPKDKYWSILAYNQSKLCCILLSMELNRRLHTQGVTCNAVHPGNLIYTSIYGTSWVYWLLYWSTRFFTKSPEQGAATLVYCAVSRNLEGTGGQYYINCRACEPSLEATDPDKAKALWSLSERLINHTRTNSHSDVVDV